MLKLAMQFTPKKFYSNWAKEIKTGKRRLRRFVRTDLVAELEKDVRRKDTYPGPVVYPIQWTSEKQRRYYFGVVAEYDAQGNIIPYERKGTLYETMVIESNGQTIYIYNANPIADFVTGQDQQQFHANTGWETDEDRFAASEDFALDLLRDEWAVIVGPPVGPRPETGGRFGS
jgi:hypothetical protein